MFSQFQLITAIISAIWLWIFINKVEVRREMIILGLFSIFLMPIVLVVSNFGVSEIINQFKLLSIFEIIFTFGLAGIAGTIFHVLFGKHYHVLPKMRLRKIFKGESVSQFWLMKTLIAVLLMVWITIFLVLALNINETTAFFFSAIILAIYVISHRLDLFADAIWSAVLTTFIVFLASGLANLFTDTDAETSELLLFAFALGISLGPLYEYFRKFNLK